MRKFYSFIFFYFVVSYSYPAFSSDYESRVSEVILGGENRVIILDYKKLQNGIKQINWQLTTTEIDGLPDDFDLKLMEVDDQKSVDENSKILISSSASAVVLIDRETKKLLFYAIAPNAHSVEYLPNDRIAIAMSTSQGGNRIAIYDAAKSNIPLFQDELYSGHGVVWNEDKKLLYVLGYDQLRAYSLEAWESENPQLSLKQKWQLPETGGHDLFAPTSDYHLISTSNKVWKFDNITGEFTPFGPIASEKQVKSIYYNDETKELIYTKGGTNW
ncbi:MAG: hypothetical protein HOM01_02830, partial [Kordiimonadaceae bacterium]|nr:hypothetical protein [Kordiimonadaceae bacterium]